HTSDQRTTQRQASNRHHQIDGREQQNLARYPGEINQEPGQRPERVRLAKERYVLSADKLENTGNYCRYEQAQTEEHDEHVRHHRRYEEMSPFDLYAVEENYRHGVLQNRKRQCTEKKHGQEQNTAYHLPMGDEVAQLSHHGIRLARHNKLERCTKGYQEAFFIDDM